ncbi:MAG: hypothetical protein U0263_33850 [Polyangiaceae bacterium]
MNRKHWERHFAVTAAFATAALMAVLFASGPASAGDEIPELDRRARAAYEAGEFAKAASLFREIFRVRPKPAAKFNEALAWDGANRLDLAADAYEILLSLRDADAPKIRKARQRLEELRKLVGYVTVECPIGAAVDAGTGMTFTAPAKFHVVPGTHRIKISSSSRRPMERSVDVGAGERVVVDFPCEPDERPTPTAEPQKRPAPAPPVSRPRPDERGRGALPWVLVGGAAVLAGTSVYFAVDFANANDDFNRSGDTDADARDRALRSRLLANAAGGAALVCAGVGIYLFVAPTSKQSPTVAILPDRVSATLRF